MTDTESKQSYTIKPIYRKSAMEKQDWENTLSTGKPVQVQVCNLYRWGDFTIELSGAEKEEILKKDEVELDDYDEYELIEMWDGGCDFYIDTLNEGIYTTEEKEEIENLLYKWQGEVPEYEDEDDEGYSYEKMEQNGWFESDCHYVLGKCELKLIEDNN
jgi:hypothetical protein